ncbi:hypothetical protein MD484_g8272, partial [Candolleomyces efflorescens]
MKASKIPAFPLRQWSFRARFHPYAPTDIQLPWVQAADGNHPPHTVLKSAKYHVTGVSPEGSPSKKPMVARIDLEDAGCDADLVAEMHEGDNAEPGRQPIRQPLASSSVAATRPASFASPIIKTTGGTARAAATTATPPATSAQRARSTSPAKAPSKHIYADPTLKRFSGRGRDQSYHWYRLKSDEHLEYPPAIPAGVDIPDGAMFLHVNTETNCMKSWLRKSIQGQDCTWLALHEGDEHVFEHGTYIYSTNRFTPSWATAESIRKKKYTKSRARALVE